MWVKETVTYLSIAIVAMVIMGLVSFWPLQLGLIVEHGAVFWDPIRSDHSLPPVWHFTQAIWFCVIFLSTYLLLKRQPVTEGE